MQLQLLNNNSTRLFYVVQPIHGRHRRSVFTFSDMVKCATGKDPARYNGYGCYCGLGGHGEPLDDVDR